MEQLRFPVTKKEAERAGIPYSSEANKNALFPSRLRALREEKGVSQAGLAAAMGVSKSTIGLYETGDTLPDVKTADQLASYFDISADYLIGRTSVRSEDLNVQRVCAYTGLSEIAIEGLHDLELEPSICGIIRGILSTLIQMEEFENLLLGIHNLETAITESLNRPKPAPFTDLDREIIWDADEANEVLNRHIQGAYKIVTGEAYISLLKFGLQEQFDELIREVVYGEKGALSGLQAIERLPPLRG